MGGKKQETKRRKHRQTEKACKSHKNKKTPPSCPTATTSLGRSSALEARLLASDARRRLPRLRVHRPLRRRPAPRRILSRKVPPCPQSAPRVSRSVDAFP